MNTQVFEEPSIPKAVLALAIPAIASDLVSIIYNMADTFFVGQTGDPNQVAAVSLALPIFILFIAVGNIFGIGGGSLISRLLGEGNVKKVKAVSSFCFYGCILFGVILSLLMVVFLPNIVRLIGCSENTIGFTRSYLTWIAFGGVFIMMSNAFANIVRSEGAAKTAMTGMMIGTIVNIVLDPIMILALGMGVAGAAIATVIGNMCTMLFYLRFLMGAKTGLSLSPKHFSFDFSVRDGITKEVFIVGLPASVSKIIMNVSMIVLNTFLAAYGDTVVAAMGIALKSMLVISFLQQGFGIGIMPLIGYAYGAKQYDRMRKALFFTIKCTIGIGIVLVIVFFLFTKQLINVFIDDTEVIAYGVMILRALILTAPIFGIVYTLYGALQAMDKSLEALLIMISRQGLAFLPALAIGNMIAGLNGIVYAQPIADTASVIMAAIMFTSIYKKWRNEISTGQPLKAGSVETPGAV
jgi:putative MATE family efflux protein